LEEQASQGFFVPHGRQDVLTAAIGRPEHHGRVRAIGASVTVGFPLQLLFGPLFLYANMFKGNPVCRKAHQIVKYLKLKWMNPSIKLMDLVLDRVKFINKALLKETLIIDDLEQN